MKQKLMNHRVTALMCVLILVTLLAAKVLPVSAASKYMQCRHADFEILLDEDGGAAVTETLECYFGGDPITRYRRNYRSPDPSLCRMEVTDVSLDGFGMELLDAPDDSRPAGCAAVYGDDDGSTHVEVYLQAQDEVHTIAITYYLENAVVLYEDVAEFQYTLSSENEAFDIDSLDAHIEIPYGTKDRGLAFWAHTPAGNAVFDALVEDGMVNMFVLQADGIPADQAVTIRFAMPLELFPWGSRYGSGEALDRILEEEHADQPQQIESLPAEVTQEETDPEDPAEDPEPDDTEEPSSPVMAVLYTIGNVFATIVHMILRLWTMLSVAMCVVPFLFMALFSTLLRNYAARHALPGLYAKKRLKPVLAPDYYRTLPDDLKPAVVNRLMSVYPIEGEGAAVIKKGNAFSATILDLTEEGLLSASRNGEGEIVYRLHPDSSRELTAYEQAIVDLFTGAGAAAAPMTTAEITSYMRKNYDWCKNLYRVFDEAVEEAFHTSGLIQPKPEASGKKKNTLRFAAIYGLVIGIGFIRVMGLVGGLIVGLLMGIVNSAAIRICWEIFHPEITLLTQEGENRYALWKAYASFLRDFTTFEERNIDDLKIWRKHLVYAAALGCSEQVIANLKISMPEIYDHFADDPYLWGYEEVYRSASEINEEGGYTIWTGRSSDSSSSSDDDWDGSSDSDWGGCSDSSGDSDSGSSGSDFD